MQKTDNWYMNNLFKNRSIDFTTGCWNWNNGHNEGYGRVKYRGRMAKVSRLILHFLKGFDLNSELFVCHRCDNKKCFNPEHLFIGTASDNMKDMYNKRRGFKGIKNQKLTIFQVLEIRRLFAEGWKRKLLADRFNISYVRICFIIDHPNWNLLRDK